MQTVAECQASQALLGSRSSRRFQARNADRLRARILGVSRSSKKSLAVCATAEKQASVLPRQARHLLSEAGDR